MKQARWLSRITLTTALLAAACSGDDPGNTSASTSSSSGAGGGGGAGGAGGGGSTCGDGVVESAEACDDGNTTTNDGCDDACAVESGWTCDGTRGACVTSCGHGISAGSEGCDDGNTTADDGCDAACAIESGWSCDGMPSACVTSCGDGIVAGAETCDDGNMDPNDGCDAACAVEGGWTCTGNPSACVTSCGDGVVAGAEACDDGNMDPSDGCDAACSIESGWSCDGMPSACVTSCGDGIVAGAETCDDGNMDPNDGCDAACAVEGGWSCMGAPSACITTCGDGVIAGAEACDDGNMDPSDGCDAACAVEGGWSCMGAPSACVTTCGDGIVAGAETCDDANTATDDGCDAACAIETGWSCVDTPSACTPICGDGMIFGAEACDDGNTTADDGCGADCTAESGWTCTGTPSACITTCGDGIKAGSEQCDDGNTANDDGCTVACFFPSGESCAEPLTMANAGGGGGLYAWDIPKASVFNADGAFACDPNGIGPDAVIKYVKTSGDVASGGKLLHVAARTQETSTSYYLNLEIMSGTCDPTVATSEKCLWYKRSWTANADVPAGTYYIWVGKNSTASASFPFPAVTVTIEEVDPQSQEGEGCFAPYTTSSSIYTPPAQPGDPHTWTMPASIDAFDMAATWGEPGSISCDNHATYGDITGVDAVIEYNKQDPNSIVVVDVQNLDPTITQSDLDVELLNECNPESATKVSYNCSANADTHSLTANAPAGPLYVWVTTEATSEEFNGAEVKISEIFPGLGESWGTAEPIFAGTTPINPTSAFRLDPPSCFPAGSNVHWYVYTVTNSAVTITANVAGPIAFYDDANQPMRTCTTAAPTPALAGTYSAGKKIYIAVPVGGSITSLSIEDIAYNGVKTHVPLDVTFATTASGTYGMGVSGTELFVGNTSKVFQFPITGGVTATERGSADGITTTHLGYDLTYLNGQLFSVDSTTSTTASRLFRILNGTTWGPTAWDLTPSYPTSSGSYTISNDGTNLIMATRYTTGKVDFYSFPTTAPAVPVHLGTNTSVDYVVGLAADAQYFYVAGQITGTATEGIFRIPRASITTPATQLMLLNTSTTCNNMEVDDLVAPQHLYVREYGGDIHAIVNPASASPYTVWGVSTLGDTGDYAMTFDHATKTLYFVESETVTNGAVWALY